MPQDMHWTCLLSLFEIPKWRPPLLATQSKGPLSTYSSNEYADRLCPHSGPRSERVTSRPPPPAPGWSKKLFCNLGTGLRLPPPSPAQSRRPNRGPRGPFSFCSALPEGGWRNSAWRGERGLAMDKAKLSGGSQTGGLRLGALRGALPVGWPCLSPLLDA